MDAPRRPVPRPVRRLARRQLVRILLRLNVQVEPDREHGGPHVWLRAPGGVRVPLAPGHLPMSRVREVVHALQVDWDEFEAMHGGS